MNYYIDTEFLEGTQEKRILSIKYGQTKTTIDLISIGIVAEDDREYYAISKEFNLKEAWNRWEQRTGEGDRNNIESRHLEMIRNLGYRRGVEGYWIRNNVLKPIYEELVLKEKKITNFCYSELKRLIKKYGKTKKQITNEIKQFVSNQGFQDKEETTQFYGYYADYDWVVFCWLFGKMNDLPKDFPQYCIDLKQELDAKALKMTSLDATKLHCPSCTHDVYEYLEKTTNGDYKLSVLKEHHPNYPKQTNEHNALADAKWNKQLHQFLKTL